MHLSTPSDGRRILVVTPQFPDPPFWGFAIRVRELVRQLSTRHRVTLLTYVRPHEEQQVAALSDLCESIVAVPFPWSQDSDFSGRAASILSATPYSFYRLAGRPMQKVVNELTAQHDFDVIQVESSPMSALKFPAASATVLDEHNIEYEIVRRSIRVERSLARKSFSVLEYLKIKRAEQSAWRLFDGCAVTSNRELPEVQAANGGRPVAVVPNGVDLDFFHPQSVESPSGLVFTGLMRYRPNVEAMTHFVREVLPQIHRYRPDVTLTIVGWGASDEVRQLLGPRVNVTGRVPDIRPYLAGAAAVIAPIRMGGGTRLKVLEALAMARPLIATPLACEGIDVVPGCHAAIADGPEQFAEAVLDVLSDRQRAEALGRAGRRLVEAHYGWQSSLAKLEDLHDRVLAYRRGLPAMTPVVRSGAGTVPS